MLGAELKSLMLALDVTGSALAKELAVDPTTVRDFQRSVKLVAKTESKVMAALGVLARRQAGERRREAIARMLATADDTLLDLSTIV